MDLVNKILSINEETPILVHSKIRGLGESFFIFSRFGENVELNPFGDECQTLVGNSLYGIQNFMQKDGVMPQVYSGRNDNLLVPLKSEKEIFVLNSAFETFQLEFGEEGIKKYLMEINHWGKGANFENRLSDQMATGRVFGRNREYI